MAAQREAVDAFFAAGRDGDFDELVSALNPDVVLRGDFGPRRRHGPGRRRGRRGRAGPQLRGTGA